MDRSWTGDVRPGRIGRVEAPRLARSWTEIRLSSADCTCFGCFDTLKSPPRWMGFQCMRISWNHDLEKIVRIFLDEIRKLYRVDSAYLFGSHAKGTPDRWSDIDLAVVSPDFSEDLFEERLILMHIASEIDDRIEPKPFRPDNFNPIDPLVHEIQKHGVKLI